MEAVKKLQNSTKLLQKVIYSIEVGEGLTSCVVHQSRSEGE